MNCAAVDEATYSDLRRIARRLFARESAGHPLQPEALLHEAWLRVANAGEARWREPGHFLASTVLQMRFVLIDYGRRRRTPKHGFNCRVPLESARTIPAAPEVYSLDLRLAMERLHRVVPAAARVVELKFYAGMTDLEIATAMECSARTVRRHWRFARKWLRKSM